MESKLIEDQPLPPQCVCVCVWEGDKGEEPGGVILGEKLG